MEKMTQIKVNVKHFFNKDEDKTRFLFEVKGTFKSVYVNTFKEDINDKEVLQRIFDTKGYEIHPSSVSRAVEAYERNGYKVLAEFEATVNTTVEEVETIKEEDKTKIVLPVCEPGKDFIPKKEYFLDIGILDPIKAGIMLNMPVLLIGETGVGKTSVIRHLAAETGNGFRRVNLNGSTNVDDFVGRWKLNREREMVWIDGVLVEAMKKGLWLLCDEINACLPEISFVLHSVLDDDRYVVLTGKDNEIVSPHKDFRFFASMNPEYAGTHALNLALQDRFGVVIQVDYPKPDQELEIVLKKSSNTNKPLIKKMIQVANKCRLEYKKEVISTPFSTRRLIDWAHLSTIFSNGKSFYLSVLNKSASKEDQIQLKDIASVVFPDAEFKQSLVI